MRLTSLFSSKAKLLILVLIMSIALFSVTTMGLANETITSPDGNGYRTDANGWIFLHIQGAPYERGFQHGYLLAPELTEIKRSLEYLTLIDTGMEWEFFVSASENLFTPFIDQEYIQEMKGIADGANSRGVNITWREVLAWNGYMELTGYWWPTVAPDFYAAAAKADKEHCSAFIATGSYSRDGKIVMAHNSWDNFEIGQFFNLILDIQPKDGHRIFMQSVPGFIDSGSDFFVTDIGLMGTETTIGGFNEYDPNESPEFFRARKAMQYADSLDQWIQLMEKENNGGYANSWLLGDANTGEIVRFELGLKYSNVTRTNDGYFIGYNEAIDPKIRNLECDDTFHLDIRGPMGARQVRLTQLMNMWRGLIDADIGKKILADHFDVYLQRDNPGCRTIDGHYELDSWEYLTMPGHPPYQPKGAVDGKVVDSDLALNMSFWGRWGNSAGMPFDVDAFLDAHIQYDYLRGYLKDRPAEPWTLFSADDGYVE
jgi:hypothetical protein